MAWQSTGDPAAFAAATTPLLRRDPERNTVALGVLANALDGVSWSTGMRYAWLERQGTVSGAVMFTPSFPLLLVAVPEDSLGDLIVLLGNENWGFTRVSAEVGLADRFASAWRPGAPPAVWQRQRLYRLSSLRGVPVPPGNARLGARADTETVARWLVEFQREAHESPNDHAAEIALSRVEAGLFWLWVVDGEPVSMAGRTAPAAGIARIGPVYTPPQFRRSGYGTAVTAACTQSALDDGAAGVVLFTDLANPTSNAIYQSIGYVPVSDRVILEFG